MSDAGSSLPLVPSTGDLLDLEREWLNRPQHDGRKAEAVRDRFGLSVTRYYQLLNSVIDSAEALEHDAVTTRVVLRRRAARSRGRSRGSGLTTSA